MGKGNQTSMGAGGHQFPSTRWSVVAQANNASGADPQKALEELCRIYWKPVYAHIRKSRALRNEEAKDLTQEFFIELMGGGLLTRATAEKGTFRGYLRGAVRLFLLEEHRKEGAQKRGGGRTIISFDDEDASDAEPVSEALSPEECFDRKWAEVVVDQAVVSLKEELLKAGKETHFHIYDEYDLKKDPSKELSYEDLAAKHALRKQDITQILVTCRSRVRKLVVERIRDYVREESEITAELSRVLALLR